MPARTLIRPSRRLRFRYGVRPSGWDTNTSRPGDGRERWRAVEALLHGTQPRIARYTRPRARARGGICPMGGTRARHQHRCGSRVNTTWCPRRPARDRFHCYAIVAENQGQTAASAATYDAFDPWLSVVGRAPKFNFKCRCNRSARAKKDASFASHPSATHRRDTVVYSILARSGRRQTPSGSTTGRHGAYLTPC